MPQSDDATNYYQILGLPLDATVDEVHHAYLAKVAQLQLDRFREASADVTSAVQRASVVVDQAWHVLGDPALRANYDREADASGQIQAESPGHRSSWRQKHAEHVWEKERELDLPRTTVLGVHPPGMGTPGGEAPSGSGDEGLAGPATAPSEGIGVSPFYDHLVYFEKMANWIAPHPKASPTVIVPNVCGMHASEVFHTVAMADLHIKFVRLTEHPTGDGIVVDQAPPAGSEVHRYSTLTVQVVHESL